jgi:hypothetical protein
LDFHVLTVRDWLNLVQSAITNHPDKDVEIDEENVQVWLIWLVHYFTGFFISLQLPAP